MSDQVPRLRIPPLVLGLIIFCVAIELSLQLFDYLGQPRVRTTAYEYLGFWPGLLRNWQPNYPAQDVTMFFTYGFLHGGILHLAVNMITLWSIAPAMVARIGMWRFTLLYLMSMLGGALGFGLLAPTLQPMVGASGALFGLAGAIVAWLWLDRNLHRDAITKMWQLLAYLLGVNAVLYWAMQGQIAWETHLGGFVAGALLGWLLDTPEDELVDLPPPAPERRTYIVGDIHGAIAPLEDVLAQIEADRAGAEADIVFVGDYVDRGPESAAVLERVRCIEGAVCLKGNHEVMMLNALDDPERHGARWLHYGGQETLRSFGIFPRGGADRAARLAAQTDALIESLPDDTLAWLKALPLEWSSGNVLVVHAYSDLAAPPGAQPEAVALWSRPPKAQRARNDEMWVVHGHTVVKVPRIEAGHIAIDTGAWETGRLTAAVLDGGEIRFLQSG